MTTDQGMEGTGQEPMRPAPWQMAARMRAIKERWQDTDPERAGLEADELVVALLRDIGYSEMADEYFNMRRY